MFGTEFIAIGQREEEQSFLVSDVNAALHCPVGEGGRVDAIYHLDMHGLGAQVYQTLAQVIDIGVGEVADRTIFWIVCQLTLPELDESDNR